ncbi:cupin domain-containing protein [Cognatishimia sp. SS12]|uniref:cupin domain-containing protein n=1 Tax=Cognatishimia sp. SS12 TaxID=2979465 RepID=UPI00232C3142|nr:cupin domain-containing protein [Cognatishimia sp. SS12]MDC0737327.1 cupin domain-containing protein [Cognatishimia sp. SS12]
MTAEDIIKTLKMQPHPEGGHYVETWRANNAGRPVGTAIYFLLQQGERSHWHQVDATEIWHFYAGAPLKLHLASTSAGPAKTHILGTDLMADQQPQIIVPAHHWQAAETTGAYTLVGCTVSPGFDFAGFTLAAPGFDIPRD